LPHPRLPSFPTRRSSDLLISTGEIVWQTMLQRRVPNELLGRVASVDWFVSAALVPVSFVLTGPVAAAVGASKTVFAAGIIAGTLDRKSTRLNSSHVSISY